MTGEGNPDLSSPLKGTLQLFKIDIMGSHKTWNLYRIKTLLVRSLFKNRFEKEGTVLNTRLKEGFEMLKIPVSDSQLDLFDRFYQFYSESHRKLNLSSLLSLEEFAVKHVLDSASALSFFEPGEKVADLGSGGGFPGVVLKILRPDLHIDLIDVVAKKTEYLTALARFLNLEMGFSMLPGKRFFRCIKRSPAGLSAPLKKFFSSLKKFLQKMEESWPIKEKKK